MGGGHGRDKRIFKEDEFLAVVGTVSEERFSDGLRIAAEKAFDIVSARGQYGLQPGLLLPAGLDAKRMREVLTRHRLESGLPIAARVSPQGVACTLQFGEEWRVAPSHDLQLALTQLLGAQEVVVEYRAEGSAAAGVKRCRAEARQPGVSTSPRDVYGHIAKGSRRGKPLCAGMGLVVGCAGLTADTWRPPASSRWCHSIRVGRHVAGNPYGAFMAGTA